MKWNGGKSLYQEPGWINSHLTGGVLRGGAGKR